MTRIKLCGLRREEDAVMVGRAKPDFAGVILASGFRRSVEPEVAHDIRKILPPSIPLVGVFVNDDPDKIVSLLDMGVIDIAQLHGQETDETVREVQKRTGKPVWKVFQISETTDFTRIEACPADVVLLDAGTGSGKTFDWSLARRIRRPFLLAGGLNPDNVAEAIAQTHPWAVDTSSGVETDGWKDEAKIAAFVQAVRAAE